MKMPGFSQPGSGDMGAGGLAFVAVSVAAEICRGAPADQAHQFFVSIGRRMADFEPFEGEFDLATLRDRFNAFWRALDWGEADVEVGADAIFVIHRHLPDRIAPDPYGCWATMLLGVLEGVYDSWFRALGSGPALKTTARWHGEEVEIRHGR